jgi:hypothetical protein
MRAWYHQTLGNPSYLVDTANFEPEGTTFDARSVHVIPDEQDKLLIRG